MQNSAVRKLVFRISLKLVLAIAIPLLLAVATVTTMSVNEFSGDKTKYVLYVLHLSTSQVCKKAGAISASLMNLDHETIDSAPALSEYFAAEYKSLEFSNNYLIELGANRFLLGSSDLMSEVSFTSWLRGVVASPINEATSIEDWGDESFILSYCRFGLGPRSYLSLHLVPKDKALASARALAKSVIYVALFVLLISLLISFFLAQSFSRPIKILAEASDEIAAGNFSYNWKIGNRDEIGLLSDHLGILKTKLRDREIQLGKANQLANMDHLTHLWNRRFMEQNLEKSFELAARYDRPLSVVYFDLDHFKSINDTYGHDAGDAVLVGVGSMVRESVRKTDFAARVGGEEFVVILPETDFTGALAFAKNMLARFRQSSFPVQDKKTVSVTASVGIATRSDGKATSWKDLLTEADQFSYKSKRNGRNRINHAHGEIS